MTRTPPQPVIYLLSSYVYEYFFTASAKKCPSTLALKFMRSRVPKKKYNVTRSENFAAASFVGIAQLQSISHALDASHAGRVQGGKGEVAAFYIYNRMGRTLALQTNHIRNSDFNDCEFTRYNFSHCRHNQADLPQERASTSHFSVSSVAMGP